MKRVQIAAIAALAMGCGSDRAPPAPGLTAAPISDAARAPELPGTIWFMEDTELMRYAHGAVNKIALGVFPSAARTADDSRLIAISSRGDGMTDSEQVVLVAPDGSLAARGRTATEVRDPSVIGDVVIVAANTGDHSELYAIDLAHPARPWVQLTTNPEGNFAPAWIPGTTDLVFTSSRDGDSEVYRMAVTGRAVRRLTAFHKDDWQPTPSPDGKTIAFLSDREGPARIFTMKPDGTAQARLTGRTLDDKDEAAPVWSSTGMLAYVVDGHVWLRDVAARTERDLTPAGAHDAEPSVAPDGAWIAVSRDDALWVIPTGAGAAVKLHDAGRLPRWMP